MKTKSVPAIDYGEILDVIIEFPVDEIDYRLRGDALQVLVFARRQRQGERARKISNQVGLFSCCKRNGNEFDWLDWLDWRDWRDRQERERIEWVVNYIVEERA